MSAQLIIDWTRCDGHGLCAALLPRHVARDEWGFPAFTDAPLDEIDVKRAVAACPALALSVQRDSR